MVTGWRLSNMHLSKADIDSIPKVKRLTLINSVTGIKPANLIGSASKEGYSNLAIFSSVIHLGSAPALLGFILRPHTDVRRDTYQNILETGHYTINHVPSDKTCNAHYTSAKFDKTESEFDHCGFSAEYYKDFKAPYVGESVLKIGMQYLESVEIRANNTVLVIGQIEHLSISDDAVAEDGSVDLCRLGSVGVGGLNSYYDLCNRRDYPYARREELPHFDT